MARLLFFGCWDRLGHALHTPAGRTLGASASPWGFSIDAGLLDQRAPQVEGVAVVAQRDGWTAISFWDRSADPRPGSNTAFLVDELVSGEDLLARAREAFPAVFARFGFEVRLANVTGASPPAPSRVQACN